MAENRAEANRGGHLIFLFNSIPGHTRQFHSVVVDHSYLSIAVEPLNGLVNNFSAAMTKTTFQQEDVKRIISDFHDFQTLVLKSEE